MLDDGGTLTLYWASHRDYSGRGRHRAGGAITVSAAFAHWGVQRRHIHRVPLSGGKNDYYIHMLACGISLTTLYEEYLAEVLPHVR